MFEKISMSSRTVRGIAFALGLSIVSLAATNALAANDKKSWLHAVAVRIAKKHVYPRAALMKEVEGKAKVRVSVGRDGTLVSYDIVQPTGQRLLDRELPKMMKRIDPLPKPPAGLSDSDLTFVIPVSWSLD